MNTTEIAWAAGFFDGEGCVNIVKRKTANRPTLQLAVGQSGNTEALDRFTKAVGGGKVYGPYNPKTGTTHQISYKWRAHGQEARRIMQLLDPYLCSPKRIKYAKVEPICA